MTAPDVSAAITRKSASNLALAFTLLPPERRAAMATLYAFCREVDDVADEESAGVAQRREQLARWRADVLVACRGGTPELPVNRELQPVIHRYGLSFEWFDELIRGCEMDLETLRYEDFAALERYCYRVASVVGLLSIEIFGYRDPGCRDYAIALGQALQLTNILRDVGNDATRGRIYLPLAELRRYAVTEEEILGRRTSERFEQLGAAIAARARHFYQRARELVPPEDRPNMVAAELMGAVYWRLLKRIERRRFRVLEPAPIRLSRPYKAALIVAFWMRHRAGWRHSAYGED